MSNGEEIVRIILNSIVKENSPVASKVEIKPFSTDGANYTSALYEASIVTPEETKDLFAKVAVISDHFKDTSKRFFYVETFVLKSLSSTYDKLQDKYGITDRFIFPKLYKDDCVNGVPVIITENLACKGYECFDRLKSIEWNYASKSVESLAKYHALSFVFKRDFPAEFKRAGHVLKDPVMDAESSHWEGVTDAAFAAVDDEDREKLSQLFEGTVGWSNITELSKTRKTEVFSMETTVLNGEYHVIPVDYQVARVGCPVGDLLYFILLGSDQQFRQQHYHQLVDHYYEHLALMMTRFGLESEKEYGREEFESDIKAKLPIALNVAASILPFVMVNAAGAPNFERDQYVPRANELFVERFRGLMHDFKMWGVI